MIQAFVNDQKLDWAAQLLTDLENATKERASKYAVWQPPFQSGVYTTLIQGYTRSGQSGKAMEVFERMAAVDNPLQIPPTIHTYNTLLLAFVRDWNMPAFTELCESLSANTGRPAAPGITESKSNDRQATRELTKARWEEFQRERSSSGVKIPVPSYVSANRVTENLRLLSLVNSNQLDKVPDAYAKSLVLSEPPSLVTFEMLAAYHLRRMGRQDFALKSMQRPIAERCVKVLKGEQIQRLGVEATLTTVETCVKEFLQEKQQEAQEN
jgi:pentatricopeptide repeat protein